MWQIVTIPTQCIGAIDTAGEFGAHARVGWWWHAHQSSGRRCSPVRAVGELWLRLSSGLVVDHCVGGGTRRRFLCGLTVQVLDV